MYGTKRLAPSDNIPVEAIKFCPSVCDTLFQIVNTMWNQEVIRVGFVSSNYFVMLYKKKLG